ncbi:hypothetical protein HDU67_009637, partial [Dinochytrium kinnereticum]
MAAGSLLDSYVASHVRDLVADPYMRERMLQAIQRGQPFVAADYMVISVKLISIVYEYEGDIVKVSLEGDAVLVTFAKRTASEPISQLINRAAACCLEILSDHSAFHFSWDKSASGLPPTEQTPNQLQPAPKLQASRASKQAVHQITAQSASGYDQGQNIELQVHVALSAGNGERVIIGTSERMDYYVGATWMNSLSPALDNAGPGELGLTSDTWTAMGMDNKPKTDTFYHKIIPDENVGNIYVVVKESIPKFREVVHKASTGYACTDNGKGLHLASRLPGLVVMDSSSDLYIQGFNQRSQSANLIEDTESHQLFNTSDTPSSHNPILQRFINQSLLRFLFRSGQQQERTETNRKFSLISTDTDDLLSSSTRNTLNIQLPKKLQSVHGRKVEEYRQVSIVFVKINNRAPLGFSPVTAQKIFVAFLQALKEEDGVFQQFSFDDKGETMLAVFGLPPWPQKKEQISAIRACRSFLNNHLACMVNLLEKEDVTVRVSVASGQILFSELGNENRREVSLLGDIVNTAARMLSLNGADNRIVCDEATVKATE